MLTITSYFCFLLATSTITLVLFIGVNKIRIIYQARKSVGTLIK